ncbi:hypothetical protein Tco_0934000 [Tanacetum coccineum]
MRCWCSLLELKVRWLLELKVRWLVVQAITENATPRREDHTPTRVFASGAYSPAEMVSENATRKRPLNIVTSHMDSGKQKDSVAIEEAMAQKYKQAKTINLTFKPGSTKQLH